MAERVNLSPGAQTDWRRALRPGLGVKRWIILMILGVFISGIGVAFFIRKFYLAAQLHWLIYLFTLRWMPDWARGGLLAGLGLTITAYALYHLNRTLMQSYLQEEISPRQVMETLLQRQQKQQGPKIVAIGGGTGDTTPRAGAPACQRRAVVVPLGAGWNVYFGDRKSTRLNSSH